MADAADEMRETLVSVAFDDPTTPLLANADAHVITTADGARSELVDHLTAGVDWVGAVETMVDAGVTTFVEVGPGKVLTGLIKRIAPDVEVIPADDPASPRPPHRPWVPSPPDRHQEESACHASTRLRPPRRRHRPRGDQPRR